MTIEPGQPWGHPVPATADPAVARDDASLAALAVAAGDTPTPMVLVGPGDVAATLGLDGPRAPHERLAFPFDLGFASLDQGPPLPFAAHAVARRRWWRGRAVVVMNAAWSGTWYLAPRAHPNDGRLDITDGALGFRQRLLARSRVATGSHLPHPALTTRRVRSWETEFERAITVRLDGVAVGRASSLRVWVVPDRVLVIA